MRVEIGLRVVTQILRIAKDEIPSWRNASRTKQSAAERCLRAMRPPATSGRVQVWPIAKAIQRRITAISVIGTTMAVSLHSAAAVNHKAATSRPAIPDPASATPDPRACMPRQKCRHAQVSSAQTRSGIARQQRGPECDRGHADNAHGQPPHSQAARAKPPSEPLRASLRARNPRFSTRVQGKYSAVAGARWTSW